MSATISPLTVTRIVQFDIVIERFILESRKRLQTLRC